jgi:hypothetical protein
MSVLPIPKEDLEGMSLSDLRNQKKFLNENIDTFSEELKEVQLINLKNVSSEINSRFTKYGLIAGIGVILGMVALGKIKS